MVVEALASRASAPMTASARLHIALSRDSRLALGKGLSMSRTPLRSESTDGVYVCAPGPFGSGARLRAVPSDDSSYDWEMASRRVGSQSA
jgi:hypothetical protein